MSALFEVFTVHCFFGCPHTVSALEPKSAHTGMEAHYRAQHAGEISALTGPQHVTVIPGCTWIMA